MPISRELALLIIKYLLDNPTFYFPFLVVCKGYASDAYMDDDFVEIVPMDDYENLVENTHYNTFELWENVRNLDVETLKLMSKGFIEKIIDHSIETEIFENAKKYRELWKEENWECEDSEEFGLNEFLGGKAECFEESLEIIQKYLK